MAYSYGGLSIRNAINYQLDKKIKNPLADIEFDGDIKFKRIYIIPIDPQPQLEQTKKSIENLISISIEKASKDNYKSISFPAIACGDFQYPIDIIAQTMINKSYQEQIKHKISISFIIEKNKINIYNHFDKQINLLNSSITTDFISKTIQNSLIQIEKGDITKQKVDVIVISSSSDYLRQYVIMEAGEDIYSSYEKENQLNLHSLLIPTSGGNLNCRRIFFVKWISNENENILRQSINDFICNVIQNVLSYKFNSIALSPIGCGHSNISKDIIISTLINQIKTRNLSLLFKFIIPDDQYDIYQQFSQQLLTYEQDNQTKIEDKVPSTWQLSSGASKI